MADSEEFTATVVRAWDDTSSLRGIELEIDAAVHVGHTTPGQYVKLTMASLEGVPIRGYVALASMPALGRRVELLVKRGSALGDALAAAREGDVVRTSRVEGRGYPLDEQAGRDLLLFATGSGIAPLRAVVQRVLSSRERYGGVTLFHGHRLPSEIPYASEHDAWRRGGVDYWPVVSRPEGTDWSGDRGYVQDVLRARRPSVAGAAAFLCGVRGMVAGVTEALVELGLPRERVFLNF